MNNRKLVSILAITGIIANLGLATVFAQSTTNGSETVGCNGTTPIAITATASVTFAGRTTDFAGGAAPLTVPLNVDATDTRGYDPTAGTCGVGGVLQIQSPGLTSGATVLSLDLGSAPTLSCTSSSCSPSTLSSVATLSSSTGDISTAVTLVTFSEAFAGTIRTAMTADNLEVTAPSAPVPVGTYTGVITFTLS